MKIESHQVPVMSVEEFADANGLVMEIHERPVALGDHARYYAHFKATEVGEGGLLIGAYGNGATPEEAMQNYARDIELKRLVVDSYTSRRRELSAPRFIKRTPEFAPEDCQGCGAPLRHGAGGRCAACIAGQEDK